MSSSVTSLWSGVPTSSGQGSGLQHRRVSDTHERALFAGYRLPEGKPIFTLRVRKGALPPLATLPKVGGVEIFGSVEGESVYLGLMLRDAKNLDLFETFCRDLIVHVAPCTSDNSAVTAFLTRLQGWQKFLERGGEGLSEEAERGLWGELFFLRQHLWPLLQQEAIDSWHGPFATPQDFKRESLAVEVKTTGTSSASVKINSEWQLDGTGLSRLFLFCIRLQEDANGESLPQIIDWFYSHIDERRRKRFDDLLREVGYFDAHASDYITHRFSAVNPVLFEVKDGFPRLTSDTVPTGVNHIFYNLDLGSCLPFKCAPDELRCFAPTSTP